MFLTIVSVLRLKMPGTGTAAGNVEFACKKHMEPADDNSTVSLFYLIIISLLSFHKRE